MLYPLSPVTPNTPPHIYLFCGGLYAIGSGHDTTEPEPICEDRIAASVGLYVRCTLARERVIFPPILPKVHDVLRVRAVSDIYVTIATQSAGVPTTRKTPSNTD